MSISPIISSLLHSPDERIIASTGTAEWTDQGGDKTACMNFFIKCAGPCGSPIEKWKPI